MSAKRLLILLPAAGYLLMILGQSYPNFFVECSARTADLTRQPSAKVRAFVDLAAASCDWRFDNVTPAGTPAGQGTST